MVSTLFLIKSRTPVVHFDELSDYGAGKIMEPLSKLLTFGGLLSIFAGTFLLSSSTFKLMILQYYCRASRENEQLPLKYQLFGILFNFRERDWEKFYKMYHGVPLKENEGKRLEDLGAPLRGITWIAVGTIFGIALFLCNK